jgi:hypothetical protein
MEMPLRKTPSLRGRGVSVPFRDLLDQSGQHPAPTVHREQETAPVAVTSLVPGPVDARPTHADGAECRAMTSGTPVGRDGLTGVPDVSGGKGRRLP